MSGDVFQLTLLIDSELQIFISESGGCNDEWKSVHVVCDGAGTGVCDTGSGPVVVLSIA